MYKWRYFKHVNKYYYLTELPVDGSKFLAFIKSEKYTQIMPEWVTKDFYELICEECDFVQTTKQGHRMFNIFFNVAKDLK